MTDTLYRSMAYMSGSAMIECALLMFLMVPVFFGVAMIGNLIDLRQTTEQAGRYAAWEATVYSRDSLAGGQPTAVRERFYGRASQGLLSQAVDPGVNALWGENELANPQTQSLLDATRVQIKESSVQAVPYMRDMSTPTIAMSIGQQAGRSGELLDGLSGNSWGLSSDGMLRAGVGVDVKSNSWLIPSDQSCGAADTFGCVQSSSVILVDGWSAASDDQARRRVRSLMPASALEPLGNAVSLVGHLPVFKELKTLEGAFGHVDMTVLPEYAKP